MVKWKVRKSAQQIRWSKSKDVGLGRKMKAEVVVTRIVGDEYGITGFAGLFKQIGLNKKDFALVKKFRNVGSIRRSKKGALIEALKFRKLVSKVFK